MIKAVKEWLPGVLSSQIAFFAMALFAAGSYLISGINRQSLDIQKAGFYLLIVFGSFLIWGTAAGIFEQAFFQLCRLRGKDSGRLLRFAVYALSLALVVIAPMFPLLESIAAQRDSLEGWTAYLSAAVLGGVVAAVALALFAGRCASPVRLLLSTVAASAIFFLAAQGTSLFSLLRMHFRPIQISFYLMIW